MNRIFSTLIVTFLLMASQAQTVLFSEDFEDEVMMDMSGTSAQGISWTASCPFCASGDIFEVNTFGTTLQGLRGNDTNGPAEFVASGIDATGMYILVLEFDYESSGYSGSGNLECSSECSGCSGDPADVMIGSCNNCWDFLHWQISTGTFTDGGIVLGDDCNVADADHMISDPSCSSPYDANGNLIPGNDPTNLTVTITMAMWASAENMIIDNIVITGYTKSEAIAAGLIADAGDNNSIDLCTGTGSINLFNELLGSPDGGGVWSGPSATTGGDLGTLNLSNFNSGDYLYVTSTGAGCQDTAHVLVSNLGTAPNASVSGVQDLCSGDQITVTGSGNGSFTWSDLSTANTLDISTPGNYYLAVGSTCGNDTAFFSVGNLGTAPVASVSGVQNLCAGDQVTVFGNGTGNFVWSDNSTGPTLSVTAAGNYYLAVNNNCGTDTAFFNVGNLGGPPNGNLSGDLFTCSSNDLTTLTASGGTSYLWHNSSSTNSQTFQAGEIGYVLISNQCGQDSIAFVITNESVVADFDPNVTSGQEPLTVIFANNSSNATSYSWDFGNGFTSNSTNPSTDFASAGNYTVTMVAYNSFGCSDTYSTNIIVMDAIPLIIPNIFTPNNDAENDEFLISHPAVTNFTGTIFNRWGQKLFESSDIEFNWNGRNHTGKPAPDGTYFYVLEVTFVNGETESFSGAIELVR